MAGNAGNIIQFKAVTKKYGDLVALDNLNLKINAGAIFGIIGEKGCGKSTILKLMANLTDQTEGQILIQGKFNKNMNHAPVGCLIEEPDLDGNLSVYDNMMAKCLITGAKRSKKHIDEILGFFDLKSLKDQKVSTLSFTEKRKLGIGMALVSFPSIVILDDPAEGLSEEEKRSFIDVILKLRKDKKMTFVITGNLSDHLERVATDIAIIHEGRLVKEVSSVQLRAVNRKRIKFVSSDPEMAGEVLMKFRPRRENGAFYFNYVNDTDMLEIERAVIKAGVPVEELSLKSRSSEEIFDRLVNGGNDD